MERRTNPYGSIRRTNCREGAKEPELAAVWNRIESQWKSREGGYLVSTKKVSIESHPIPDAVKFYADLCAESDDYSPVAVHALNGLHMHLEALIEIFDEIREPNVLSLIEQDRIAMGAGFSISMRRLCKDMEVIRDYSRESLASDPWILQRVAHNRAVPTSVSNQDPENSHPVQ
jgi:hypothetical protein